MSDRGWSAAAPDLAIAEVGTQRARILRLRRPPRDTIAAIEAVLGMTGPLMPNRIVGSAPRVTWLGPSEWLISGDGYEQAALAKACANVTHHLADIGHGRIGFTIAGRYARDLLAKGCTIDLHPRAFASGQCAQTLFAQAHVLIECVADDPLFHLHSDISYAAHLRRWFEETIVEFGGLTHDGSESAFCPRSSVR